MLPQNGPWATPIVGALLIVSVLLIAAGSPASPYVLSLALAMGVSTWLRAWRGSAGTALRGALAWGAVAIGLALTVQVAAVAEGPRGDGLWTCRLAYFMTLAVLAGLVSVLGARNPGGGAWAILMVLLVVVFLIPWLEGGGRIRRGPGAAELQLRSPWTIFYGLLAMAGVTNYLPTRYGAAAAALGLGVMLEFLGLTASDWSAPTRHQAWLGVTWFLALAAGLAGWAGSGRPVGRSRSERTWRWFRDHWGVVWALRVQERFNRSAELSAWPVRLNWYGLDSIGGDDVEGWPPAIPEAAEVTLRTLIRRFAAPERVNAAAYEGQPEACHGDSPAG